MNKTKCYTEKVLFIVAVQVHSNLTRFSTNFILEYFSWMVPRASENTVAGHMQLANM